MRARNSTIIIIIFAIIMLIARFARGQEPDLLIPNRPDYVSVAEAISLTAEARVKGARRKQKFTKRIELGALEWGMVQAALGPNHPIVTRNPQESNQLSDMTIILERGEWDEVERAIGIATQRAKRAARHRRLP